MFNTRVLSLRVFTNKDGVDVIIRRLETLDRDARTDVGEEVESSSESQVQGNMTFTNYNLVFSMSRRESFWQHTGCGKGT